MPCPLTPPRGTRDEVQAWQIDRSFEAFDAGHDRILGEAATGTGKTRTGLKMIGRFLDEYHQGPVAWWTHLDHLIQQTKRSMEEFGFHVLVEQGKSHAYPALRGQRSFFGGPDVVILSVKSMAQKDRLRQFRPDDFALHIVDECHLATAPTWKLPMSYFDGWFKGLTATPITSSGEPLFGTPEAPFGLRVYRYSIRDAIDYGHLAPIRSYVHDLGVDLKGISTRGKQDIPEAELESRILARMEPIANKAAAEIRRLGCRKVLAFLPTVRSAVIFADALANLGVPAHAVYGKQSKSVSRQARAPYLTDEERSQRITDHQNFGYPVLANSQYLEIGYDDPSIDMILMLTATNSVVKLMQRVGRGTRLAEGKTFLHLFAVSWGSKEVVSSIDLLLVDEPDPRVRRKAREIEGQKRSQGKTLQEIVEEAREAVEQQERTEEEDAALRELEADARRSRHRLRERDVVCRTTITEPFGFGEVFGGVDLGDGSFQLATLEQRTRLHKYGFTGIAHLSSAEAEAKLAAYERHLASGGATLKQQAWVRKHSPWMSDAKIRSLTKDEVRVMMARRFSKKKARA